jgi:hypothetical protein
MILGMLGFFVLVGSAFLGVAMLIAGLALAWTQSWRRVGVLVLCAGAFGALLGVLVLLGLEALLGTASQSSIEARLLFGAAGFGWAGLLSLVAFLMVILFGRPTRWADRRRGANA